MQITNAKTGKTFVTKRRRSFDDAKAPHELTFSCYRKLQFLSKERTRKWFVEALVGARQKLPIDLWAWVVMPDHIHVIIAPREVGLSVGAIRKTIKEPVARKAIKWLEQHAPTWIPKITVREGNRTRRRFWQPGGGYDRCIEEVKTLHSMIDYIHMNPVRRGLVRSPEQWEWSSARWYAGITPVQIEMDRSLPML